MNALEYSPVPWRDDGFGIVDCNGNKVRLYGSGTVFSKELINRRLIIRAVNSYDVLLAAAKMALEYQGYDMKIVAETLQAAIAAAEEPAP